MRRVGAGGGGVARRCDNGVMVMRNRVGVGMTWDRPGGVPPCFSVPGLRRPMGEGLSGHIC